MMRLRVDMEGTYGDLIDEMERIVFELVNDDDHAGFRRDVEKEGVHGWAELSAIPQATEPPPSGSNPEEGTDV